MVAPTASGPFSAASIIARDTVEERVQALTQTKRDLVDSLIGDRRTACWEI